MLSLSALTSELNGSVRDISGGVIHVSFTLLDQQAQVQANLSGQSPSPGAEETIQSARIQALFFIVCPSSPSSSSCLPFPLVVASCLPSGYLSLLLTQFPDFLSSVSAHQYSSFTPSSSSFTRSCFSPQSSSSHYYESVHHLLMSLSPGYRRAKENELQRKLDLLAQGEADEELNNGEVGENEEKEDSGMEPGTEAEPGDE
jgi:hypothetical protein